MAIDDLHYDAPNFDPKDEGVLGHGLTRRLLDQLLVNYNVEAGIIVGVLRTAVVLAKLVDFKEGEVLELVRRLWKTTSLRTIPDAKGIQ